MNTLHRTPAWQLVRACRGFPRIDDSSCPPFSHRRYPTAVIPYRPRRPWRTRTGVEPELAGRLASSVAVARLVPQLLPQNSPERIFQSLALRRPAQRLTDQCLVSALSGLRLEVLDEVRVQGDGDALLARNGSEPDPERRAIQVRLGDRGIFVAMWRRSAPLSRRSSRACCTWRPVPPASSASATRTTGPCSRPRAGSTPTTSRSSRRTRPDEARARARARGRSVCPWPGSSATCGPSARYPGSGRLPVHLRAVVAGAAVHFDRDVRQTRAGKQLLVDGRLFGLV